MSKHKLFSGITPPVVTEETTQANAGRVEKTAKASKGEAELVKTSTYFSRAVHEKLREIAFTERKSINDLVIEGLDRVLAQRSYPSTKELTNRAKAS